MCLEENLSHGLVANDQKESLPCNLLAGTLLNGLKLVCWQKLFYYSKIRCGIIFLITFGTVTLSPVNNTRTFSPEGISRTRWGLVIKVIVVVGMVVRWWLWRRW